MRPPKTASTKLNPCGHQGLRCIRWSPRPHQALDRSVARSRPLRSSGPMRPTRRFAHRRSRPDLGERRRLPDGADQASSAGRAGSTRVAVASWQLAAAGELTDGAGQLADGTGKANDGSGQVADGAGQLADGLKDAADGSTKLTDGLKKAADGAPKLVDGAERLSDEGTKKLVEAGEDTAQNYGEIYATIEAGAERAQAEKMVYGAPEGAMGLMAFSYVIKGEDGEGSRNMARGLGGLAVLGAGRRSVRVPPHGLI